MRITSLRLITDDVARLVHCYEQLTGVEARWAGPEFAELDTEHLRLAFGSPATMRLAGPDVVHAAANRSAILELVVDDVDAEHRRLQALVPPMELAMEPTDMPWGNRSMLVRDPDGALVNLFTPVTEAARAKFGV
ncbi:VOC family protein [Angustibacter aerolatus]